MLLTGHRLPLVVACSLPLILAACGGGPQKADVAPASGVANFDGQPLTDAMITFLPEKGPAGVGKTDAAGRFTIKTNGQVGAVVGSHRVTISPALEDSAIPSMDGNEAEIEVKAVFPLKYTDAEKTDLFVDISTDGNTDLILELTP